MKTQQTPEWITQSQLDTMRPTYSDLRQTAITAHNTWHYCGTNAWFKTSGE